MGRRLGKVVAACLLATTVLNGGTAWPSDVDVTSVVDVTAPTGSVSLAPGANGAPITINMQVTGAQAGTATFEVYRDWTLTNGVFTGSNSKEFSVGPRSGGDPAATFTTSGTVNIAAGHAPGTFSLTVGVFDITNSNTSGGKLAAKGTASYSVTVTAPANTAPTVTVTGVTHGASYEHGSVPAAGCSVTDTQDGPSTPTASLTAITGPLSGMGLGSQTANCSYTDAGGLSDTDSATYSIVDTTDPVFGTYTPPPTAEATGPSGAAVNFATPTATDAVDPAPGVSCNRTSGATFPLGTTTVTCTATDASGNDATRAFDITVVDTTAPEFDAYTAPAAAEATSPSGAAVSFATPTATDTVDTSVAVVCDATSGDTFPLGSTPVNCTATDDEGNFDQLEFFVVVGDTTDPVFDPYSDPAPVEATGPGGAPVSFPTPTATDIADPSPNVACVPPSGSTFVLGSSQSTCTATDASNNSAQKFVNILVQDTTDPVIDPTYTGPASVEATSPAGAVVTFATPTATDIVDTSVSVVCDKVSGATYALGSVTATCTATDDSGNSSQVQFSIVVVDTTAPAFGAYTAPAPVEATGPSGAVVSYPTPTATDAADSSPSVTCAPPSGGTFAIGPTLITCTAVDDSLNSSQYQFNVQVVDTTGPVLSLPADITTTATGASAATVSFTATANDAVDGPRTVNCTPPSGSSFGIGTTTVNCSASDATGNTSNGSFKVTVGYALSGFFQPIDNNGTLNSVKAGASVPVKFSLSGDQGLNVFSTTVTGGSPSSQKINCTSSAVIDPLEETSTAGSSSLSYDATTDRYNYVWKTDKSWAGTCRQLTVTLRDGSSKTALFKLTK